jgi:F420-non-reducing hydrogenase iron-sulfur subunit
MTAKDAGGSVKTQRQSEHRSSSKSSPSKSSDFKPKILAFACNWCSYAGADLAGVSRFQYNTSIRIIRVMCSGRMDPGLILTAFEKGIDGVIISGCHPGDCHYISGNEKAEKSTETAKELLETLGLDERRLKLQWISAAEGQKFADSIDEFVEEIMALGRSPAAGSID